MSWLPWLLAVLPLAASHGRVLAPPSRASAWRFGFPTEPDYDDDGANCGGFSHQWSGNGGRCGICGDAYDWPAPRPHELGGTFGSGVIVAHYRPGGGLRATVDLTTSHRGHWQFKLCPDPRDSSQECFDRHVLELEAGGTEYYPRDGSVKYSVGYRLPPGLVCEHCVLQWRYTAGNNWGVCPNGTEGLGCGNQEQFGACSDIAIGDDAPDGYEDVPNPLLFYLKHGFFDLEGLSRLFGPRPEPRHAKPRPAKPQAPSRPRGPATHHGPSRPRHRRSKRRRNKRNKRNKKRLLWK